MITTFFALLLLLAPAALGAPGSGRSADSGPRNVRLTWMGIANWLIEVGGTRVVMDNYFTRIPQDQFFGGTVGLAHTRDPQVTDEAINTEVIDALGNRDIDYILTGHSHFDHSFDTPFWGNVTGAHIIGSRSTCYQAIAWDVPESQCTIVVGGEVIELARGFTVRVVRINHSGTDASPDLHEPLELDSVPTPDPATGGLFAGTLDSFPNGGGGRGFLFTVETPSGSVSWLMTDTGSPSDWDEPVVVDGVDYGAPHDNLVAAMADAGIDSVDLWIGLGGQPLAELVVPVANPDAYIPNHMGNFYVPFKEGLSEDRQFSNPGLAAFLDAEGVELVIPEQYMDKWQLNSTRITELPNHGVKRKLGLE
ncbi:MAG: MBL fold metallo-hydrolase [Haloechinothrix sp.]